MIDGGQGWGGRRVGRRVCPPPDEGIYSLVYRMHGFAGLNAALGLGVVDVMAIGLLVACVHTAATPAQLRNARWVAVGVTLVAASPFVSAVAVVTHDALVALTRAAWASTAFTPHLVRNVCCGLVLLLVAAAAAASPATVVALSTSRMRLAAHQQDLPLPQRRQWATRGGAPVAAQLALAICVLANGPVGRALQPLWLRRPIGAQLPEVALATLIFTTLALATVAALALPLRAATRRALPPIAAPSTIPTPARFADRAPITR